MSEPEKDVQNSWVERAAADLRSPIVALSLFISLVSAVPTFYGWLYPSDSARLLIHYDPFTVYDPGKPVGVKIQIGAPPDPELNSLLLTVLPNPPVKMLSPDGKEITSPVYDMEVSVWNGGSEPINRDKIRRPLVLTFPHIESLLGVRILHQNPNDGLKVVTLPSSPASLEVSWDYMDPGAGFKFAVVFATSGDLYPIQSNSYITAKIIDTDRAVPGMSWRNVITTISIIILVLFVFISVIYRSKRYHKLFAIIPPILIIGAAFLFASFLIKGPRPPF